MTGPRPTPYLYPVEVRGRISRPQPKGLPIINMGYNELPYPPTPRTAAALAARTEALGRYGAPGCDGVRAALGRTWGLDPEAIICGNGSEELLDVIARVFVRARDEILISQFGYIQFALTAHRLGAQLRKAPERDYHTDIDALLETATPQTRLLFLANPNNPTGTHLPASELARLADGLSSQTVLVLDLAYGEFAGEEYCAQVHELVDGYENVIVTRTFSKAFGLAGTRIGWAHTPKWMLPSLYAARGMGSVNGLAQACAVGGLDDIDIVRARVAEIRAERDRVAAELRGLGLTLLESASNFLMVSTGDANRTEALVEHLFDDRGIVVNRTREAGLEDFMRFSLSLPAHNNALLDSVRGYLAQI